MPNQKATTMGEYTKTMPNACNLRDASDLRHILDSRIVLSISPVSGDVTFGVVLARPTICIGFNTQ